MRIQFLPEDTNSRIAYYKTEIETCQQDLETYRDYYNDFQCPAIDCSLCMAEVCGLESLADTINCLEDMITGYREDIAELQEGREKIC